MKRFSIVFLLGLPIMSGCLSRFDQGGRAEPEGAATDVDTDGDSDGDTDSDADGDSDEAECGAIADCSACMDAGNPTCIGAFVGHVEDENGNPMGGDVQICIPACIKTEIGEGGDFCLEFDAGCAQFDFDGAAEANLSDELHIQLISNGDTHIRYSVFYEPTQAEVSADMVFDMGLFKQFALPAAGAEYTPADGVTVSDLDGVSFQIAPGGLDCSQCNGQDGCMVTVMEFPLDEWSLPFIPADLEIGALYFLNPYLCSATDLILHIDPSAAGWSDGDTGMIHVLGDFNMNFVNCGEGDIPIGVIEPCVAVAMQGGVIVADPLPLLGWVALVKD